MRHLSRPVGPGRGQVYDSAQEIALPRRLTYLTRMFKSAFQGYRYREGRGDAGQQEWARKRGISRPCRGRQPRLLGRDGLWPGSADRGCGDAARPADRARAVCTAESRQRQRADRGGRREIGEPSALSPVSYAKLMASAPLACLTTSERPGRHDVSVRLSGRSEPFCPEDPKRA